MRRALGTIVAALQFGTWLAACYLWARLAVEALR